MASPCEMRFAREEANFISHCAKGAIFHNFRKEIISHSATPNISLKKRMLSATRLQGLPRGSLFLPFEYSFPQMPIVLLNISTFC